MANTQDTQQCRARTADGERCTRSADEDGFCYQHGPEDETVDDAAGNGDGADAASTANEQGATATDGGTSAEQAEAEDGDGDEDAEGTDTGDDEGQEQTDADDEESESEEQSDTGSENGEGEQRTDAGSDGDISGVMDVRTRAESVTSDVVGAPLDRIIEIERREADGENGWLVVVEALERKAIPDTEDLLGRYAIQFGQDGSVTGYRLRERYRRSAEISDE